MSTGSDEFQSAVAYINRLPSSVNVSTSTQLQLYAAYKCVTAGPKPTTSRPSFFDMTGRAKWDAWDSLSKTLANEVDPAQTAEKAYLEQARNLGWSGKELDEDTDNAPPDSRESPSKGGGLGVSVSVPEPANSEPENSVHGFAVNGDVLGLQLLLDADPSLVNDRDEFDYTPLHLAADRGHLNVVRLLLSKGADASLKDQDGDTALEIATVAKHVPIVQVLREHGSGSG
ncbi:acyl-CoA-binding protein [Ceratobasidium sp. AG-Ba]|nr:acyl-CoA-binding protein [Ceratobasidium sp. AG-Ba]